jgi:hypothetical protein
MSRPGFFSGAKFMNTLINIFRIFPLVLAAVKAVENAIPLPGQGKKKLDLVLDVLRTAYNASSDLSKQFSFADLAMLVTQMVGKMVDLHNVLGLFDKPAQTKTI